MAIPLEAVLSLVFGIFMAIAALISICQGAYLTARHERINARRDQVFELEACL
ncbi:hypothetical protein HRR83_000042 [Exophiala dermatitidis]|uniref:Uncharacterized protein n=1 Tax=Exophiala dermatitidis TaxID=5970 RepID=A0AAN6IXR5_EXODE|nr:hypothetical protein HRR73_002576 [Exophiala dermatitidis]KAJ4527291.1 hypothetical protein HRR74_000043 [Exophiala dermatitidis]KAJ4530844.1 hypothetical protein HRR76_008538 [Exophiala dermatitidis]KAJ4558016.1 hypothetical protein HRR77_000043 [Exophiala dermatitidis]KAJ4589723.1 hypothetical protein HRR82_000130 [Exophiala dermatitidis]